MAEALHWLTLTELSSALRRGDVTSVELTRHLLERIERLDPGLHAFRRIQPEVALDAAREADEARAREEDRGPLHGLPFAVKDLFDVAGQPTAAGTRLLDDNVASQDSAVVRRLRAAGMILLGKTHTVQFAYGGAGINHDTGTPHNPWHRVAHLPGGSSSGSGVAVAAGLAPLALGTDTGGSVRLPAAFCGVTGLKTTVGRVSRAGVYPLSWSLDSVGPLVRSADDAALVLQAMAGPEAKDPSTWGRKAMTTSSATASPAPTDLRGLRIAFGESVFWKNADPEVEKAVRSTADAFRDLGVRVSRIEFAEAERALELNPRGLIIAAEAYALNRRLLEEHADELDPIVVSRIQAGRAVTAEEYLETQQQWQKLRVEARQSLAEIDALLCPTSPIPACPVKEADADLETYFRINLRCLRNTAIGNVLDLCALSVPCGWTRAGLPIGLMIYGKAFDEATVLRIAQAFQQATQFHRQHPDLGWLSSHTPAPATD